MFPFGFLPGGGTSVFPRALGLPRDPVAAARSVGAALGEDRIRRISLGSVNGRRFCFSAGLGFDAEAVRRLDELGRGADGARPGDVAFMRLSRGCWSSGAAAGSRRSRSRESAVRRSCSSPMEIRTRTRARSRSCRPRRAVRRRHRLHRADARACTRRAAARRVHGARQGPARRNRRAERTRPRPHRRSL